MNKELIIKDIARLIYKDQRGTRAQDLLNYDGCLDLSEEVFDLVFDKINSYIRDKKIDDILN